MSDEAAPPAPDERDGCPKPDGGGERDPGRERSRAWLFVVIPLLLMVFYVLSLGPMAAIVDRHPALADPATIAYLPLIWLAQKVPAVDRVLSPYVKWCEEHL